MSLSSINFLHFTASEILPGQDFICQGHYGKFKKVNSRSYHDAAHLHPLTNVHTKYQLPTSYGIRDTSWTNFFPPPAQPPIRTPWVKTIPQQPLRVKSRSHHDIAHLHSQTNIPNKYQLSTPYGFRNIVRTLFYRSRPLQQGIMLNQGQTMMLHTYTPKQCPYKVSTSYTLQFPRYSPNKIL